MRAVLFAAALLASGCATSQASRPAEEFFTAEDDPIVVPASAPQGSLVSGSNARYCKTA